LYTILRIVNPTPYSGDGLGRREEGGGSRNGLTSKLHKEGEKKNLISAFW